MRVSVWKFITPNHGRHPRADALLWVYVNFMRWLVIVALIVFFLPPHPQRNNTPPPSPVHVVRTYQLAPCDPWSLDVPYSNGHICITWPNARAVYRKDEAFGL